MALKYELKYRDYFDNEWAVGIDVNGYAGEVIPLTGMGDNPCSIIRESEADDPFQPFIYTHCDISVYNTGGDIDVSELQQLGARDARVLVTCNGLNKFVGYLVPDNVKESLSIVPNDLTLTAVDGLKMLESTRYTTAGNILPPPLPNRRSPLLVFYELLTRPNGLDIPLDVAWFSSLQTYFSDGTVVEDYMTHATYGYDGTSWEDGSGNYKNGHEILEGLLKAMPARLYQEDGRWVIERINDLENDSMSGKLLDFTDRTVSTINRGEISTIGNNSDFSYINEDVFSFFSYGLESAKVTYNKLRYKNVVPNGSMDRLLLGNTFQWSSKSELPSDVIVNSLPSDSIVMDSGKAVEIAVSDALPLSGYGGQLMNIPDGSLNRGIPIDTQSYKNMEFGFTYCITRADQVLDEETDEYKIADVPMVVYLMPEIQQSFPLRFTVAFHAPDGIYVLTEFGHWVKSIYTGAFGPRGISANLHNDFVAINDIVSVNMNKFTIKIPELPFDVPLNNQNGLYVYFTVLGNTTAIIDDVYINLDDEPESYIATTSNPSKRATREEVEITVSSSENGFYLSNLMSNYSEARVEEAYTANGYIGNLTELHAISIMKIRGKNNRIVDTSIYGDNYSFGKRYSFDLYPNKVFIETGSTYNTLTGTITSNFYEVNNSTDTVSVEKVNARKSKSNSDTWM